MSLASAAGVLLKPQTPLQQLLEDINFQRTKEMRQLLKDDSGFVVLQGTTYWTDLFVRHFLFQTEPVHSIDSDDLLFFVRKKHVRSSSRHMPKYETEVEVFRKDSRKLPIGDPDVDWEETVYLNMVIHQFDYTLTLAICTRTSPKELQVLRRHSQRVYASPSRRKMDTKGEGEEITYPHICFMVDNFDEVFSDILVRDGEMVCVELVANDKDGSVQGVIFLGSIRYDALKKVYDARQSSLSSKVAQRMSFGLFNSGANVQTRCEFVRMKGPQGKGHAEMAVTKPKGSGVETPTSEPGFCATDMWDEWSEENDDYCTYRHQRRLSDPSANLNNFTRYGWRTKGSGGGGGGVGSHPPSDAGSAVGGGTCSVGAKARSENEGLDSLASEVSEIEAGDLRDDLRPAFSASEAHLHPTTNGDGAASAAPQTDSSVESVVSGDAAEVANTPAATPTAATEPATTPKTTGCNCFRASAVGGLVGKKAKKWTQKMDTPEMSEIYCPACDEDTTNATADCLNKMPEKKKATANASATPTATSKPKHRSILSVESEMVVSKKLTGKKCLGRSASLGAADRRAFMVSRTGGDSSAKDAKNNAKFKVKERDKAKEKEKEKAKKDKEKEKSSSKTSSLLAKVSPKRMRAHRSADRAKSQQQQQKTEQKQQHQQQQRKENKENANNNATTTNTATTAHNKINATTASSAKRAKSPSTAKVAPLATEEELLLDELKTQEYEIADDATSLNEPDAGDSHEAQPKMAIMSESESKRRISVRGTEELPVVEATTNSATAIATTATTTATTTGQTHAMAETNRSNTTTTTTAATAAAASNFEKIPLVPVDSECHPLNEPAASDDDCAFTTTTTTIATTIAAANDNSKLLEIMSLTTTTTTNDCNGNQWAALTPATTTTTTASVEKPQNAEEEKGAQEEEEEENDGEEQKAPSIEECDFVRINCTGDGVEGGSDTAALHATEDSAETWEMQVLRKKRSAAAQKEFYNRALDLVPKRRTPDGTNIYYWCDLTKQALKELDDGAYNPLWASRGFTQTFHFWKEHRRQQSTPLNAFLTYVTLPWWSIAKDLLDHRETPILTF